MGFKEKLANDADNVFLNPDEFADAEPAVYTVKATDVEKNINMIFQEEGYEEFPTSGGARYKRTATGIISMSVANGITNPVPGDFLRRNGSIKDWEVVGVKLPDDYLVQLRLLSVEWVEVSREDLQKYM